MPDFKHIALRPSLAPVAKQCPSAMYVDPAHPEIRTVEGMVFSATGTALHDVFKEIIYPGLPLTEAALLPFVERHQVVMEGYFGILWRAKRLEERWKKVAQWYQGATLEQRISCTLSNGYELAGTPDLVQITDKGFGLVLDLKSGEKEMDYMAQVELYALIAWKRNQALGVNEFYGAIFAPMLDKYHNEKITAERLAWVEEFWVKAMAFAGVQYVMGPMCAVCPRLLTCPAMVKSVDPMVAEVRSGREITALDIKAWRPTAKYLKTILERYEEVERALVEHMGTIDLGDGMELYLKTAMEDKLKPVETYHVLTGEFRIPPEKVLENMKVSKEGVKEAARAIAQARSRENGIGATQVKIMKALEAQGATYKKPKVSVQARPIQSQVTQ